MNATRNEPAADAEKPRHRLVIAGHEVGDFTLLVGPEDGPLRSAFPSERLYFAPSAERGVAQLRFYAERAARNGGSLGLENLGDSLHPSKHYDLVSRLRQCGARVIATTHSPDVVDQADADEVLVFHAGKVARLSEHPEAQRWTKTLRTGEFWSTVGEAWVAEVGR